MVLHCRDCGTELPESAKFCFSCGKPLKDKSSNNKRDADVYRCLLCGYEFSIKSDKLKQIQCPNCGAYRTVSLGKYKSSLRVEGTSASDVQKVLATAMQEEGLSSLDARSPWISGSFYLVVFVVVVVALLVIGKLVPLPIFPIVALGGILALSVIGAFQLRQDERLSEENFLKLMALSFKYLPWVRRRDVEPSTQPSKKI